MKALKRLNEALPGLVVGILLYGAIVELVGVWFVSDKIRYTTGLLIGLACAIGMAIHIAMVIEQATRIYDSRGSRMISFKSVLRYLVVVVVFFVMAYFNLGNFISAFIGVLGLKVSAYAQPFLHKVLFKDGIFEDTTYEIEEEEVKP